MPDKVNADGSPRRRTMCTVEEGKTRQQDAAASDINLTIKKYNLQPLDMVPGWSGKVGEYGDTTTLFNMSMQDMMGRVAVAAEAFYHVPPEIRALFGNDVAIMLDAWDKGEHRPIFESIGWIDKLEAVPGAVPPIVPAPIVGGGT